MYLLLISLKSQNIPVQTTVSVCSPRQLDCAEEARGNVSECQQQCEGTLITNIDHDIEVENYIAANGIESDAVFEDYENFKNNFEKKVHFPKILNGRHLYTMYYSIFN